MNINIIKEKVHLAIENNEKIKKYMDMEEYAFEKLIYIWNQYLSFKISNNNIDELKSELETSNDLKSDEIINRYKNNEEKYEFLILIYKLIAYIDSKAYKKNEYNEYEDKRTVAFTGIIPPDWVKSLINYRKYKDLSKVSEVARNVIKYIISPEDKLAVFKNKKLQRFTNILPDDKRIVETDYDYLCNIIYEELDKCDIKIKNNKNKGKVYAEIIFSKELTYLWEKDYFKVQPYKGTNLDRDIISRNLENNIIVFDSRKKDIEGISNIFYAVEDNKILFIGSFTGEFSEQNDGYHYNFIKIKEITENNKYIDNLDNNNVWANKSSSKKLILVSEEDKKEFEREVVKNIFNLDTDDIILNLKNYIKETPEIMEIKDELEMEEKYTYKKEIETPLNIILYGPPGTGKTYNTVNYAVSIIEKKELNDFFIESRNSREDVFNRYKKYIEDKKIVFTTFHQNYSYEDFIQGIKANINNTDQLSFVKEDGIFKDIVERAKNDLDNNYVLIIDEINRGNISRVFGELITLIEDDKRLGQANETILTLPSKENFVVPPNLYIIGTMNTADKSIANIDIALRRRFDFVPMYPNYDVIPEFKGMLQKINEEIYNKKKSADYLIGHAFFINKNKEDLHKIINNKIIPLLNEYFYMNSDDVEKILKNAKIKIKKNENTFQLEYDGIE